MSCIVCKKLWVPGSVRSFHKFPKDPKRRQKWMEIVGISKITSSSSVCSDHFTPASYHQTDGYTTVKRLLASAEPIMNTNIQVLSDVTSKATTVNTNVQNGNKSTSTIEYVEVINGDKQTNTKYNGQTRDAIVQPGVSQWGKDLVVESETSQTHVYNTYAPEDIIECTYPPFTESAVSDVEEPSTFTTYEEQRSFKNNDDHKPRSHQSAIETTASIQHSELNRIEELELEEEVQLGTPNTQISDGSNSKEEIIERHKCYAIIANVYRYLKQEYDWLQRQLGSLYDVSALSDILARTAAAAGVSQRDVTRALHAHRLHAAIRADHSYIEGVARDRRNSGCIHFYENAPKHPDFSLRRHGEIGTPSHKQKQEDHENHAEKARHSKKRTTKRSIRSKPSNEDQLLEEHDGESMGPPVRRSTRISVTSKLSNEEQLPFPSPIQLRVHGVMETECKTEPADDDGQPTPEDYPLESRSWSHHHCEQATTTEETEMLFKTEPADDECSQDLKPDPFELESSVATLQEPPDSPDTPQFEVKFECVDEDMNVCEDYSVFDPMYFDIKPEPPK